MDDQVADQGMPQDPQETSKKRKKVVCDLGGPKYTYFQRFLMVNLADLRSPWGVLGAGGVLGGPWEVQSRLWEGSAGSQGTGHGTWRLQGGVWEPTLATPGRVHIHQILRFVVFFDDFGKTCFCYVSKQAGQVTLLGRVGSAPCGPFGPPGECANSFLSSRGPLWSGQSSHHDDF